LSEDQHRQIARWLAALGTPQQVALRCRIILAIAAGKTEIVVAAENRVKSLRAGAGKPPTIRLASKQ
jgi:hypothetical protein